MIGLHYITKYYANHSQVLYRPKDHYNSATAGITGYIKHVKGFNTCRYIRTLM